MSIFNDDRYWNKTYQFIKKNYQRGDRIIAPHPFEKVFNNTIIYSESEQPNIDTIQWLILHKGMIDNLDITFIHEAFKKLSPVFANEVFIILTGHDNIKTLKTDNLHLIPLLKFIEQTSKAVNQINFQKKSLIQKIRQNQDLKEFLSSLLRPVVKGKPNLHELYITLREAKAIQLNVKNLGYLLATEMYERYENTNPPANKKNVGLKSKLTTQADIESDWVRYWCQCLHMRPIYHRKVWELCYVAQAIYENTDDNLPKQGLGFGCGEEPLASLFASWGHNITVTDLHPEKVKGLGWDETAQHTESLEKAYRPHLVERDIFEQNVQLQYVDMNEIPKSFDNKYDYCWSVCAFEHLGSIQKGLEFVKNAMNVLKPGGVAVHTTEFNYTNEPETIDNWMTVIFQQKHIEKLADELMENGYDVAPLDFSVGNGVLDRFIDIPPYAIGERGLNEESWQEVNQSVHLKLSVDGIPCTCLGLIIRKPLG